MNTQIKTIDVNAKEWFDKLNGNSYFSGNVTINFGMPDQVNISLPFQYGYDNHYEDMAFKALQENGFIPVQDNNVVYGRYYEENNIAYRHSKQKGCRKRELMY